MKKNKISHEQAYEYRMAVHKEWLRVKKECEGFGGIPNAKNFVKKWNTEHPEFTISYSYFIQKIKYGPNNDIERN